MIDASHRSAIPCAPTPCPRALVSSASLAAALSCLALLAGCHADGGSTGGAADPRVASKPVPLALDLPLTVQPYERVHANFKERLDQPYVYREVRGSYAQTMRSLAAFAAEVRAKGLVVSGPPFGLYYDDPGATPLSELRSRLCLPVDARDGKGLPFEVLPQQAVVYAYVAGPYPEVPRALPGLLDYMRGMRWRIDGPVREVYLVPPSGARAEDLVCELQVPVKGT
ncbi:MAG: hypothetical protein RIR65_1077 [Planctomycetota bacterium]